MNQAQWDDRVFDRPGLEQYFRMDEASGFPQDVSGNGRHQTSGTGSVYQVPGPFSGAFAITQSAPWLRGHGGNFSGPITMETWFRMSSLPASRATILAMGNVGITMETDGELCLTSWWNPGQHEQSGTSITVDTWYYLAASDNAIANGLFDLYVNEDIVYTATGLLYPIPAAYLRSGFGSAFNEFGGAPGGATYSNMAWWSVGELAPDFPEATMVASMSAVVPPQGA